jgi:HEAT repeat protein
MKTTRALLTVFTALALAAGLSACGPERIKETPEAYARARVSNFITALASDDENVRVQAAYALGNVPRYVGDATPALTRALIDPSDKVRSMAAWALRRMGREDSILEITNDGSPGNSQ